ncbi:MAG: alpha-2-macroglobulin [Gammaproteobacteria bacterium]|nr:alpha-2-macroglobulin [Gammaproteobacteria bacterium]
MVRKGLVAAVVGEISWTPPAWIVRIGLRRFAYAAACLLAVAGAALAAFLYVQQLPEPLRVAVDVAAPAISRIDDGDLIPDSLRLDFRYTGSSDEDPPADLSAARLDLVGERVVEGVELQPPHPGEWRFATENRLVFKPSEDWPAGRAYRVRLSAKVFAPGVELADRTVRFETPAFVAAVTSATFYQHPEIVSERRVTASFSFSHPVSRSDLEDRLTLSMREDGADAARESRPLGYRVEYGPHDRTAHVLSEVVQIPEREQFAILSVTPDLEPGNGDAVFEEALYAQIRLPDRSSYFRVDGIKASIVEKADGDPVQTAVVAFTDQVNTEAFRRRVNAWLLPRDRRIGNTTYQGYRWRSPSEVTPDVLAASERLDLVVNPTEREAAMLQSVTLDAPPGRHVYLRVDPGLVSAGEFVLESTSDGVVQAPRYPKEAGIAQDGALLPLTGNRLLTIFGRGVEAIKVDLQQLLPRSINHLASQTGGDIRDPWFRYGINADNLSVLTTRIIELNPGHPRERKFATLDLNPYLPAGGLFFVTVQGWNPRTESTVGSSDRRMALVTDLGLLVKTNVDQSQHVFVHSIATGEPVSGAEVELLGKNGLAVIGTTTDADGHARLASAAGFQRDGEPTVFVVRRDTDVTFMPYRRGDRRIRWSGFDVGGEQVRRDEAERLKAVVYTDRGLYRPGETVRLFSIVRRSDLGIVPGTPIEVRVADPRGRGVYRTRTRVPDDGLFAWNLETLPESPTGTYAVRVDLVEDHGQLRALGGASFRVEEFQPDRLRIRAAIIDQGRAPSEQQPGGREMRRRAWLNPGEHYARVTLHNLFGTAAQGRRVVGSLAVTPVSPVFPEHPGYRFTDPFRDPDAPLKTVRLPLADVATDTRGIAELPFDLRPYDNGIYRLRLTTEGFEASGGRSVKARTGTLMSPATALLGYKADGDLDFIALNGERTLHYLAIDQDLEPVALDALTAVLVERRYVSALVKRSNGTFAYQSVVKETERERAPLALPAAGTDYVLPTSQPGRFALDIVDVDGTKLCRTEFVVAGAANLAGNLERDAELDLKIDRREYRPGDEIVLEVTAPYAGTGLVTIERDRVYAFKWFRSDTNQAVARIRLPADLEGNAYLSVAFVRDIDDEEIFVSPLSYAVLPFAIDPGPRRLDIALEAPARSRPGERLRIGYSASAPSRIALFAVDEGILQVADYATPNPLSAFLNKKALQVDTHQMVDLILPDYDVLRRVAAPGGGDAGRLLGANLNPFRRRSEPPVAFWFGILTADPGIREVDVAIPDYFNGELRVMAVGVAEAKLGATSVPVTVRGPVVLTPNLPLAVAPNDVFELAVGVANNVERSGATPEMTVTAGLPSRLVGVGDLSRTLVVAEGDEGRTTFGLRASAPPGAASVKLTASIGETSVERTATMSVRPAAPFETTVVSGFEADGDVRVTFPRRMFEPFADRRITASASPLALADGLLAYLEKFPHACVEQLVSKAFPQLGLLQAPSFGIDEAQYRELFRRTIEQLRPRQDAGGGFRFWLTATEPAPFASVYVAHFLTDAGDLGLPVPSDIGNRAATYLRRLAQADPGSLGDFSLGDARTRAYAIYLLTRRGRVTTNDLDALQGALQAKFGDVWRGDLASAYMAASHALLRNHVLARGLIDGYRFADSSSPDTDFDTRLGRDAQYLYLLARHFPERLAGIDGDTVHRLVEPVFKNRFNTLSAAYTTLALGEIHRSLASTGDLSPPALVADDDPSALQPAASGPFARASVPVGLDRIRIETPDGSGLYYTASESGFDVEPPSRALADGIEVDRAYLDADGKPVDEIRVGDELTVRLRIRTQGSRFSNVAVTDLLPGGFEILAESVRARYGSWSADYRDVREDRLAVYGSFDERVTEIRYRVKATNPGTYTAPAAHAAAMYHRGIRGNSAPGKLIVTGA